MYGISETKDRYTHVSCCMIPCKLRGAGATISCILSLCVGELCHSIFYHVWDDWPYMAQLTNSQFCISGDRYIINHAASTSDWVEWRLFEVRKGSSSASTNCRGRLAFIRSTGVVELSLLATWFECVSRNVLSMYGDFLYAALSKDSQCHYQCIINFEQCNPFNYWILFSRGLV